MNMCILILPAAFILILLYTGSLTESLILWNSFAYFDIQILSVMKCLDQAGLLVSWSVFMAAVIVLMIKKKRISKLIGPGRISFSLYAVPCMAALASLLFIAIFTVPYNYDSMTYHLPRIMFWIQNHSVGYYFANDSRQLVSSPFTEYIQMETMLLSGSDRLFNLVSYCGAAAGTYYVYKLTDRITHSGLSAGIAAFLYISIPIVEAESVSTQVDVFAAMWVMVSVYLIYTLSEEARPEIRKTLLLGCSVGLCFMTKTNACIPLAVMLIFLLVKRIRKHDKAVDLVRYMFMTGIPAFIFAVWSFVRNCFYCGDILAGGYMSQISIGSYDPRYMILNFCKNIVMLGVVKWNPVRSLQLKFVKAASVVLGVDINAPEISFVTGKNAFQNNTGFSYQQDYAGAQVLTAAIIVCVIIFIVLWIRQKKADGFLAAALIQFAVMLIFVRWQPWGSRLIAPSLALMCIFVSCVIQSLADKNRIPAWCIMTVLMIFSVYSFVGSYRYNADPALINLNGQHSENELYFYNNEFDSGTAGQYEELCRKAADSGSRDVGIYCAFDWYEYPALKMLMDNGMHVENIDPEEPVEGFSPDCILCIGAGVNNGDVLKYNGYSYIYSTSGTESDYLLFVRAQ